MFQAHAARFALIYHQWFLWVVPWQKPASAKVPSRALFWHTTRGKKKLGHRLLHNDPQPKREREDMQENDNLVYPAQV